MIRSSVHGLAALIMRAFRFGDARLAPVLIPSLLMLGGCTGLEGPTGAFTYQDDRGETLDGHLLRLDDGFNGDIRGSTFSLETTIVPQLTSRSDGWVDASINGVVIHSLRALDEQTVELRTTDNHYITIAFGDDVAHLGAASISPTSRPQVVGVDDILEWGAIAVLGIGGAVCAGWDVASCSNNGGVNWDNWKAYDISSGYSVRYCDYSCPGGSTDPTCHQDGAFCNTSSECCYSSCNSGVCGDSQPSAGGCGDVTYEGSCQGNSVTWCESGTLNESSCDPGSVCGWDSANNFYGCISDQSGDCGDVTYEGECQGNTVAWCENGTLHESTCNAGSTCGWDSGSSFYSCIPDQGGGSVSPHVQVTPSSVVAGQGCVTQSLSGFSPSGGATCHPANQWGESTFQLSVDAAGSKDNKYCPNAGAGLGQYEFWCVDSATGAASNHVFFTILP